MNKFNIYSVITLTINNLKRFCKVSKWKRTLKSLWPNVSKKIIIHFKQYSTPHNPTLKEKKNIAQIEPKEKVPQVNGNINFVSLHVLLQGPVFNLEICEGGSYTVCLA